LNRIKKFKEHKHPSGNILGTTMSEFIILPARARIAFIYNCEFYGEGFFGIKRI